MSSEPAAGGISKHRLEALSDGIFAIVMTLLILELRVPSDIPHGQLAEVLKRDLPEWFCFVLTFAIAARYWVLQHRVFSALTCTEAETTALTMGFLGLVTTLPFTTSLFGRYFSESPAFFLYALNTLALGILLTAQYEIARIRGHIDRTTQQSRQRIELYLAMVPVALAVLTIHFLQLRYCMMLCGISAVIARTSLRTVFRKHKA